MAPAICQIAPTPGHKHSDSMDSEVSYFETSSSCTTDSWNSYFDGWDKSHSQDLYCPQIARSPSPQQQSNMFYKPSQRMEVDYVPTTLRQKRPRPDSISLAAARYEQPKVKRFGLVSHGDQEIENEAIGKLNGILQNSSASTEDLLGAMYNPSWDVASLQRWYQNSSRTTADLALYKIMFSLRYTPEEAATNSR